MEHFFLSSNCDAQVTGFRGTLHSHFQLWCAGQGIVCFAKGRYSEKEFAMKFFACNEAFVNEHELYKNPALKRILPEVHNHFDTDGDFKDPYGR